MDITITVIDNGFVVKGPMSGYLIQGLTSTGVYVADAEDIGAAITKIVDDCNDAVAKETERREAEQRKYLSAVGQYGAAQIGTPLR